MAANKYLGKGLSKAKYTPGKDDPPTPEDMEMSNRHLRDRIRFNKKHEDDHKKVRLEAEAKLKERGEL